MVDDSNTRHPHSKRENVGKPPPSCRESGGPGGSRTAPIVVLEGTPRERGRRHGETLRPQIHEAVALWRDELASDLDCPVDGYLETLVGGTRFLEVAELRAPDLVEEVRGLADGSGIGFTTMFAFQLVDEDWWFRRNQRLGLSGDWGRCSVLAIAGDGSAPPVAAQNLDIPKWSDGLQVILRLRWPDRPDDLVFTYAGMIGLTGVGGSGVAVCVNSLIQLDTRGDGLPVAFVVRELLGRTVLEDVVRFVIDVPHASGQCYVVAAPAGIAAFECSAAGALALAPQNGELGFCHTNHPLLNSETRAFDEIRRREDPAKLERSRANSERRLRCLRATLDGAGPHDSPADIAARALRSHGDDVYPICCHVTEDRSWYTAWSVIYQLSDPPQTHFTCGPPCLSEYRRLMVGEAPH
jgi:hypothetical protein